MSQIGGFRVLLQLKKAVNIINKWVRRSWFRTLKDKISRQCCLADFDELKFILQLEYRFTTNSDANYFGVPS